MHCESGKRISVCLNGCATAWGNSWSDLPGRPAMWTFHRQSEECLVVNVEGSDVAIVTANVVALAMVNVLHCAASLVSICVCCFGISHGAMSFIMLGVLTSISLTSSSCTDNVASTGCFFVGQDTGSTSSSVSCCDSCGCSCSGSGDGDGSGAGAERVAFFLGAVFATFLGAVFVVFRAVFFAPVCLAAFAAFFGLGSIGAVFSFSTSCSAEVSREADAACRVRRGLGKSSAVRRGEFTAALARVRLVRTPGAIVSCDEKIGAQLSG